MIGHDYRPGAMERLQVCGRCGCKKFWQVLAYDGYYTYTINGVESKNEPRCRETIVLTNHGSFWDANGTVAPTPVEALRLYQRIITLTDRGGYWEASDGCLSCCAAKAEDALKVLLMRLK